jgi:hypothetical protein
MSCDEQTAKLLKQQAEKYRILANSNDQSDMLSTFLEKSTEILSCGPDCEQAKQSNDRLKKYEDAQMNLFSATDYLEDTSKEYYTYSKDEDYYNTFNKEKITEVADKIAAEYANVFQEISESSYSLVKLYESNLLDQRNSQKLSDEFSKQNAESERTLKNKKSDVATNDRKTYYQDQELNGLKMWNKLYYYVYLVILVTFFVSAWVVPSQVSFNHIIFRFAVILLWFFFGQTFLVESLRGTRYVLSYIPKNIYLHL